MTGPSSHKPTWVRAMHLRQLGFLGPQGGDRKVALRGKHPPSGVQPLGGMCVCVEGMQGDVRGM